MKPKKIVSKPKIILILSGILAAVVTVNIIFLYLSINAVKTVNLLKKELEILDNDSRIIAAAEEISRKYSQEIDIISNAFPDEAGTPMFVKSLESEVRKYSDEFTIKFNSLTPVTEQDKLYLLLTVSMKTDFSRLLNFFDSLEKFPYMTHITGLAVKSPGGFNGKNEVSMGLKVYVQNPFKTK
jgi:hypothetical protein